MKGRLIEMPASAKPLRSYRLIAYEVLHEEDPDRLDALLYELLAAIEQQMLLEKSDDLQVLPISPWVQ